MPRRLQPMLATLAARLPLGDGWAFEFKWDGYRLVAHIDRGRLRLLSRRQQDYTARAPELAPLASALEGRRVVLDGELVALVEGGRPSFQALQNRIGPRLGAQPVDEPGRSQLAYMVFDLLYLDGRSLLDLPYHRRRAELAALDLQGPTWWVPPSQAGDGQELLFQSDRLGHEGVVAKRVNSPYRPGARSREWLKVKHVRRQEFVVVGWMPSDVSPGQVGSLLLGYYDPLPGEARRSGRRSRLVYAGKVGTGFTQRDREHLRRLLLPLQVGRSPIDVGSPPPGVHFVRPVLVGEVAYREWSWGGELRHPSWQGLRADRAPTEVTGRPVRLPEGTS
jgi:bifunctional non-homologous end joining protein LigD